MVSALDLHYVAAKPPTNKDLSIIYDIFCWLACLVDAISWGYNDAIGYQQSYGYVASNGKVWLSTYVPHCSYSTPAGFYTLELNLDDCTAVNIHHFDTNCCSANSVNMTTYISGLYPATVLIGVTTKDAANQLTNAARNALNAIGVNVTELQIYGKVVFISQIGRPSATLVKVSSPGGRAVQLTTAVNRTYI